jgi:hypothetical protein
MSRCKYCGESIGWIGKAPVTGQEVNILPVRGGDLVGITAEGLIVQGVAVGDSNEGLYWICKIKHECRRVQNAVQN